METVFTITLIIVAAGIFLAGYFVTQPLRPAKAKPVERKSGSTVHDGASDGGTMASSAGVGSSSCDGGSSGGD